VPEKDIEKYLLIVTTLESPLYSLYITLREVYKPKLREVNLDFKVQQALEDLENGLKSAIVSRGTKGASSAKSSEHDTRSVVTGLMNTKQGVFHTACFAVASGRWLTNIFTGVKLLKSAAARRHPGLLQF
jgi:hypothetical protein